MRAITPTWWREVELHVGECYHCHLVERSWTQCMWGLSLTPGGEKLNYMYVRAITVTWWREVELHVCEGYHCHLVEKSWLHVCEGYHCHLVERSWTTCMCVLSLPPRGEKLNYMGYHYPQVERSWTTCEWVLSLPPGGEKWNQCVCAITSIWRIQVEMCVLITATWRVKGEVYSNYHCHLVEREVELCVGANHCHKKGNVCAITAI